MNSYFPDLTLFSIFYLNKICKRRHWVAGFSKQFKKKYSISCGLPAAPAPGQIAGPGTRPLLTAKRPAHTGLIKVIINTLLCRY
jgi:hypothetical protein